MRTYVVMVSGIALVAIGPGENAADYSKPILWVSVRSEGRQQLVQILLALRKRSQ